MTTIQANVRPEDLSHLTKGPERIPDPGILVIFGASGDLTKRKLLPALFHLRQADLLPREFAIVGVARRPLGDEFAADMRAGIVEFGSVDTSDPKLDEFIKHISYFPLNFDDPKDYAGRSGDDAGGPGRESRGLGGQCRWDWQCGAVQLALQRGGGQRGQCLCGR